MKDFDTKQLLEYYLTILNDDSLTYQDKVEVLTEKINETLKTIITIDKDKSKNKCPNYSEGYGCAISPLKQCNLCIQNEFYK